MNKNRVDQINEQIINRIMNVKSLYSTHAFDRKSHEIRQNQLDAKFLKRKHRLQKICKENKFIFEKIYMQKSSYSKDQYLQDYTNQLQISQRISKTKKYMMKLNTSIKQNDKPYHDGLYTLKNTIQTKPVQDLTTKDETQHLTEIKNVLREKIPNFRYYNNKNMLKISDKNTINKGSMLKGKPAFATISG